MQKEGREGERKEGGREGETEGGRRREGGREESREKVCTLLCCMSIVCDCVHVCKI